MGNRTHSPELVVARLPIVARVLVVTRVLAVPVSVHVRWPSFVSCGGHFGWWWFVGFVVRGPW